MYQKTCTRGGCARPRDRFGDLCNNHGHMLRYTGSAHHKNLLRIARRPFITAASRVLTRTASRGLLNQGEELLMSCRAYCGPQADVGRKGYSAHEKAKAILARIHQVHEAQASLKVLAAFLGTFSMPMPTSAPRYCKIQIARAIYTLCTSEHVTLFGKTTTHRISMQGFRIAVALYDLIEGICWPVKEEYAKLIKLINVNVGGK